MDELRYHGWKVCVGASGTVQALQEIMMAQGMDERSYACQTSAAETARYSAADAWKSYRACDRHRRAGNVAVQPVDGLRDLA